jgi:hypothetical protein
MSVLRVLLIAFNVALITYLVYRLMQVYRSYGVNKGWIFTIGIFLLLLPTTILMGFVKVSAIYVLVYPVAIGFFLYFIKDEV